MRQRYWGRQQELTMTEQDADERDLDFSEIRKIDEHQFARRAAFNLHEGLSPVKALVWKKAGENGGLVIRFDPQLFIAALARVRFPGLSTTAKGRNSPVEVAVFENSLRMRSQSPYITFEAELPLKQALSDLPQGGVAFLTKPSDFEPFFSDTSFRSHGKERSLSKHGDPSRGLDMFEYLVDEGVLVLAFKESRIGLKVQATTPAEALPKIDADTAVPLPSIKALEQALRCAAFVTAAVTSRNNAPVAVIKDGQCTAQLKSRAAIFDSVEIAGIDLAIQMDTPLKLATMIGRIRDPARLAIIENQALIEGGELRCAFPVLPSKPPAIAREQHIQQSANSTWTVQLHDLQHLWGVLNVFAQANSQIDLTIIEAAGSINLQALMQESDSKASDQIILFKYKTSNMSDELPYRNARILFRDFSKSIEKLSCHQVTISIDSAAVIITEITDKYQREYFIGRSDITTSYCKQALRG